MSNKELIFYISDGEAYCPDCANILRMADYEEASYLIPVYSDGTGDDSCGLICACGIAYDMKGKEYYDDFNDDNCDRGPALTLKTKE